MTNGCSIFGPVVLGGRALDLTECECRRRPQDEGMRGRRWDCAVAMEGRGRLHVVIVGWVIRCEEFSLAGHRMGFALWPQEYGRGGR